VCWGMGGIGVYIRAAGSVLLFTQLGVEVVGEIELNRANGRIRSRGQARPQRSKQLRVEDNNRA
jgi:hypothetical protein